MIRHLWNDKLYWAAIMAAPLFCLGFWFTQVSGAIDWSGPISYPQKFLLLSFAYPVLEEIVFRGLLQSSLDKWLNRKRFWMEISRANVITSIIFMIAHFMSHSWYWAVAVLGPSLIFGYFRDKYQNITPSIILHVFYNTMYFAILGFQ